MTWQRIDENTYIDNTLVTCVEYQLFIDEMREQGKYYQPDHWTSYQFPRGNAQEPILGVRFSDAKAFCDWLTKREAGKWLFRMSTFAESEQYSLHNPFQQALAVYCSEYQTKFIWVGLIPANPRKIDIQAAFEIDRPKIRSILTALISIDITSISEPICSELVGSLVDEIFDDIANVFIDPPEWTYIPILASALNLDNAYELIKTEGPVSAAGHQLGYIFDSVLIKAINRAYDGGRDQKLKQILNQATTIILDRSRVLEKAPVLTNVSKLTRVYNLDLFLDLYTLQERIAGRSPAFEGIRLVKERIR